MGKLIIGNLKMHLLSPLERNSYLNLFEKEVAGKKLNNIEIVLCPPYIHLEAFSKITSEKIQLGAQNMFWERKGSFTGEISPSMLKNFGCEYVILGHSERRRYFAERDEEINLKIMAALKCGLRPVLCVGENAEEKSRGMSVVVSQLRNCLGGIAKAKIENIIICYEPVWAISSNNPDHLPSANEIMSARLVIKKFLVEKYSVKIADKVRIIYGGSVNALNAGETCVDSGMGGALVGKESLSPHEFVKIAEIINN